MKKELKWKFEVIDMNTSEVAAFAYCTSMANCYFTRPLYDEDSEKDLEKDSDVE